VTGGLLPPLRRGRAGLGGVVVFLALVACGGQQSQTVLITSAAGPNHQVLGVGVGYAHNQAGALAAAVTYAEAAATPIFPVDDASERQRVDAYTVSSEQAAMLRQRLTSIKNYDSSYGVVTARRVGLRAGAHLYPLTVALQSYSDSNAVVSIWANLVEYSPDLFRATYLTEDVALQWDDGDWKFVLSQTKGSLGPVPAVTQAQTATQPPDQVGWQAWGR
jgi:hypothetical protein